MDQREIGYGLAVGWIQVAQARVHLNTTVAGYRSQVQILAWRSADLTELFVVFLSLSRQILG
jgi:hypothetical protein